MENRVRMPVEPITGRLITQDQLTQSINSLIMSMNRNRKPCECGQPVLRIEQRILSCPCGANFFDLGPDAPPIIYQ